MIKSTIIYSAQHPGEVRLKDKISKLFPDQKGLKVFDKALSLEDIKAEATSTQNKGKSMVFITTDIRALDLKIGSRRFNLIQL